MAKHKYIETPEKMWELFQEYVNDLRENPILIVEQKKGNTILPKDISNIDSDTLKNVFNPIIELPTRRPLTLEGFENWCADNDIISDLSHYFCNLDKRYNDYVAICTRIKRTIRQDQIEGGMAGIYNASITQRLNGLKEQTENTNIEKPIFKGIDLNVEDKSENIEQIN